MTVGEVHLAEACFQIRAGISKCLIADRAILNDHPDRVVAPARVRHHSVFFAC